MTSNVLDKVAIVTGATSGIGKAITERLIDEGAKVVLVGRNKERGENVAKELNESKSSKVAIFQCANTGNWSELAKVFETTYKTFGKINIVINNAGILGGKMADIWNDNDEAFEAISEITDINFKGVIYGTRLAIKYLVKNGEEGGCIINTSSVSGYKFVNYAPVYSATKSAVITFTKSAALVSDKVNICIGVVCPSFTDTPMIERMKDSLPDDFIVDMKDVVESYFKFINDPKGLNGATISIISKGSITIKKLVDPNADLFANFNNFFETFDENFEKNMKRVRSKL